MMMWLAFGYIGMLPVVLFVLLCGNRDYFEGTWVQRVYDFIFAGGCLDTVQAAMKCLCGQRGSNACTSTESYCCEQSNPVLQLFYLALVGGCYFSISSTSLQYIPGHYLGQWHKYVGQGAVLFGIVLFLMTSFCDPGVINAASLESNSSNYPYSIIHVQKQCSTCKTPRPARSKHCSICNRCVARFDHHCGWMNNCIGENNLRYFLAFLMWHVGICWYGVYLLVAILAGEVHDRHVIQAINYYHGTSMQEVYPQVIQWLFTFYSAQVLMIIFLAIMSVLLVSFTSYHVYLVVTNATTNETYKWDQYQRHQAEMAWSKILEEEEKKPANEFPKVSTKCGRLRSFFTRSDPNLPPKPKPASFVIDNIYNRGLLANVAEVMFPLSRRSTTTLRGRKRD